MSDTSKILARRLEARLNDARFAWAKLDEAKKAKAKEIKSIAEKISAASGAIELLLRDDHESRAPRSVLDECAKLQKRVDKYTAHKKSREDWHKSEISKRDEILAAILSQGADQLPLLLPEVSVVSDIHLAGALLTPGDVVTLKGAHGVLLDVVGFKTVGEDDDREEVVIVRDAEGNEFESGQEELRRATKKEQSDAARVDPKVYGGLCVGDEVHHRETGEVGKVVGYSAGSKRVRVRWDVIPTPFEEDANPNDLELDKKAEPEQDGPRLPPKKKAPRLKVGDRVIVPDDRAGIVTEILAHAHVQQPDGRKRKIVSTVSVKIDGLKTGRKFEAEQLRREPKKRKR